ncbi:MAG: hypothetical protein C0592_07715 [Marinilabiliales bacterium]|nr:MAG: hypothetical protein C0592_07715 [Marinilabiliales bacterium]
MKHIILLIFAIGIGLTACKKDPVVEPDPSDKLALDSLVTEKQEIVVWEKIYIDAYTRGENISFLWSTNHGTLVGSDSSSVQYYACPTCLGLNTIECTVSNDYGSISDTIMIRVKWD